MKAITVLPVCGGVLIGYLIYAIIKNGDKPNFAEAFERGYFTIIGILIAFFVLDY